MDATRKARWAQIVFWDRHSLNELHRREEWLAGIDNKLKQERYRVNNLASWQDDGFIWLMQVKHQLIPYWPKGMDMATQQASLDDFKRQIYPIWMPIWHRNIESTSEWKTIHLCDIAIFENELKPNREFMLPQRAYVTSKMKDFHSSDSEE